LRPRTWRSHQYREELCGSARAMHKANQRRNFRQYHAPVTHPSSRDGNSGVVQMIARLWRGKATSPANADAYVGHVTETDFPSLTDLAGHGGAWLLRREVDGGSEFLALTLWESRQSIEAFTGPDIAKAIVEPRGRAVLSAFDDFAHHYEVVA